MTKQPEQPNGSKATEDNISAQKEESDTRTKTTASSNVQQTAADTISARKQATSARTKPRESSKPQQAAEDNTVARKNTTSAKTAKPSEAQQPAEEDIAAQKKTPDTETNTRESSKFQQAASNLKQGYQRVKEKIVNNEPVEPEPLEIPIEGLGQGLLSTAGAGLESVTSVGRFAFLGIKYGLQDGLSLTNKAFSYTKGKLVSTTVIEETPVTEPSAEEPVQETRDAAGNPG